MDIGVQLEHKFSSLENKLEFLSLQLSLYQRFLKHKFQREFDEFAATPERFEVSKLANTLRLSSNYANKEVASELKASNSHNSGRLEDSNSPCGVTLTAATTSTSSKGVKKLRQEKQVKEDGEENFLKRPCHMKLRKRAPSGAKRDGQPGASEITSVDSSSSQDKSVSKQTRRDVGFRSKNTMRLERKKELRGPKPSGSLSTVRLNKRIYKPQNRFICSVCPKRFPAISNLRSHELIHTEEKPFVCYFCEKSFRQLVHLLGHELIHTGEKPHKCSICPKRFRDKSNVKRHEVTHRPTQ